MQRVNIPEPCGEDISQMRVCGTGRHCATCKTDLFDLRKKDLGTINKVMEKNPGACVVVNHRHTSGNSWRYDLVNRFEVFLHRYKMVALSSVLVPSLLFLSGCKRHPHKVGRIKSPSHKVQPLNNAEVLHGGGSR